MDIDQFESKIKEIKRLYQVISGKDTDVYITYLGQFSGITKSWQIKIDNREFKSESLIQSVNGLIDILAQELAIKISQLENQLNNLKLFVNKQD